MIPESPFHAGERAVQERMGVRDRAESLGRRFIRDHLPDEHRAFYPQLPMLLVGSIDVRGRPWASVLVGRPGFIESPDSKTLHLATRLIDGDPLQDHLDIDRPLGVLGIQYHTRRRNRLSAHIASIDENGISLRVAQTFGNCPQYIHGREPEWRPGIDRLGEPRRRDPVSALDGAIAALIENADHFYIASHFSDGGEAAANGADVSHRGGRPGFVRIDDARTLTFPDFSGNNHFNTLGNIAMNPVVGLLFIDFDSGDLVYLTGHAEIVWDGPEVDAFEGARRLVRFTLDEGLRVIDAMPMGWSAPDFSPSLEGTGQWAAVDRVLTASARGPSDREMIVTRVESESETVRSLYLEPADGRPTAPHAAGQYLPIALKLPGRDQPLRRTYTLSHAANGKHYRISVKRESGRDGEPPGVMSNVLHDELAIGSRLLAQAPRGSFVLDEMIDRPLVLISAGIGITPMLAMLEAVTAHQPDRPVWFIHGARNGRERAFASSVRQLAEGRDTVTTHMALSTPDSGDRPGRDFDSEGRIDQRLIQSLLPLADYEFYLCGPAGFMRDLHRGLRSLGVSRERIHHESFGPSVVLDAEPDPAVAEIAPAPVRFETSGIDTRWSPEHGTLLDLAESAGLSPAFSCRNGQCGTCQTRLLSGRVHYPVPPQAVPDAGTVLICCAVPGAGAEGVVLDL